MLDRFDKAAFALVESWEAGDMLSPDALRTWREVVASAPAEAAPEISQLAAILRNAIESAPPAERALVEARWRRTLH